MLDVAIAMLERCERPDTHVACALEVLRELAAGGEVALAHGPLSSTERSRKRRALHHATDSVASAVASAVASSVASPPRAPVDPILISLSSPENPQTSQDNHSSCLLEGSRGTDATDAVASRVASALHPVAKRGTSIPHPERCELASWAKVHGIDLDHPEAAGFVDHHMAKGSVFKSWPAAWRTWLRNAPKFAGRPGAPVEQAKPPAKPVTPEEAEAIEVQYQAYKRTNGSAPHRTPSVAALLLGAKRSP